MTIIELAAMADDAVRERLELLLSAYLDVVDGEIIITPWFEADYPPGERPSARSDWDREQEKAEAIQEAGRKKYG